MIEGEYTYTQSGVDVSKEEYGLKALLSWTTKTFGFSSPHSRVRLSSGYYANILDIGENIGIAFSTDGVGTKILVAQLMDRYDTLGIDCVAMNVNDILCVGARPLSMVDYIALEVAHSELLEAIAKGLYLGAEMAGINICGGEIAQMRELIRGAKPDYAFDLVGSAIGRVDLDRIIIGQDIEVGDIILGLASSGIHSNGLTLARKVLFDNMGLRVDEYVPRIDKVLGEELLTPTRIYVKEINRLIEDGIDLHALNHITSDGLLNLKRVEKRNIGFIIDYLPEPQAIFSLIQEGGNITDAQMFMTFNMGIGFCIILPERETDKAASILTKQGVEFYRIGYVIEDEEERVIIEPKGLISEDNRFR